MTTNKAYACPRCEYPLIPVHAVEGTKRRVIALTCPEPYCDHMQMVPKGKASHFAQPADGTDDLKRAVN